jgi:signal transduction histidine kinase
MKQILAFILLLFGVNIEAQNLKIIEFRASDNFHDSLYRFDNQAINLDYRKTHILITYKDFADSINTNYEIQLKGFEKKWYSVNHQTSANYANLFGGNYDFNVRNKAFPNKITSVKFHLEEAFWQRTWFIPTMIAYLLLLGGIIFYFFNVYRLKQKLRFQNVRNDIAADLHDDVGATLSSISFLTEIAKKRLKDKPEDVSMILDKILSDSKQMVQTMRGMIWSMNPSNDNAVDFFGKIENLVVESLKDHQIKVQFNCTITNETKLSVEQQRNVFLVFKESINNIMKYAKATEVEVVIVIEKKWLMIQIQDNGIGFESTDESEGNGLRNMKNRIIQLGGTFEISGNKGTRLRFMLPLN